MTGDVFILKPGYFMEKCLEGDNMKEFNWEGFRNGEFAVSCDTEEKAKDFVKEAYEKGVRWVFPSKNKTNWCFYKENTCYYGQPALTFGDMNKCRKTVIEWRNDNMKNFREVIRDIKEGEVWESENRTIRVKYGNITIENKTGFETKTNVFDENVKYELKQQPVTFEEVLNSDKRCRVEHELLKHELYKEYCDFDKLLNKFYCGWDSKEIKEIIKNGKWYLEP